MSDAVAVHLLDALEHAVRTTVQPEVKSAEATATAEMSCRLLSWLAALIRTRSPANEPHANRLHELLTEAGLGDGRSGKPHSIGSPAQVDVLCQRLLQESPAQLKTVFERFLEAEEAAVAAHDPGATAGVAENYKGGRTVLKSADAGEPLVTAATLTRYLKTRFPEVRDVHATDVRVLPGGFGKDTILFTIVGMVPCAGPVVIRKDLPVVPLGVSAVDEFPLLVALFRAGIPVPEPLWAEPDAVPLGSPFIVVRWMPGTVDVNSWVGDSAAVRRFANELARVMAQLHRIGPEDLGFPQLAGLTAAEGTRKVVLDMLALCNRDESLSNSRLELIFAWLLGRIPSAGGRSARLVHGDIGFHNLLIQDGRVTAVLDWEYAHFGDPGEDVAYCRPFVESVMPWPEFLQMYEAHGGVPYTDEQDRFYSVWRNARNAAGCVGGMRSFLAAPVGSIKLATAGIIFGPRFELEALRAILRSKL
ncbi:MAG TPA: phosphotransferase family protein [Steroidobacteraceae bacterium]|nr:phosphotransferase family protein [Steroidobacteraceae bacterium]